MPTITDLDTLVINKLTESQYDAAVQAGIITDNDLSIITDIDDSIQVSTMPTADSTKLDKIYQFIGTTDATYTNGYFYKCVSDGQDPATYSWQRVDVQPSGGSSLPDQTGQSGKFLTTDGTDASWGEALTNTAETPNSLAILGSVTSSSTTGGDMTIGGSIGSNISQSTAIGFGARATSHYSVAVGHLAVANYYSVAVGKDAGATDSNSIAIGKDAHAYAQCAIQLGSGYRSSSYNGDANTLKVANSNGNFEIMSADGTIPTDRFTTTPTTDGTYVPTLTISSGTASRTWSTSSGGSTTLSGLSDVSLSSLTSGQYLKFDGTNWVNDTINVSGYLPTTGGTMTGNIVMNSGTRLSFNNGSGGSAFLMGPGNSNSLGIYSIINDGTYGLYISTANQSIEPYNREPSSIGVSGYPFTIVYTTKINNGGNITVPNQTGTMVVADASMVSSGQVLTLDSNLTPTWATPTGGTQVTFRKWGANE